MTTNFNKITAEQINAALKNFSPEELMQLAQSATAERERKSHRKEVLAKIKDMLAEEGISTDELLESLDIKISTSTSAKKEDKKYSVRLDGKTFSTSSKQLTKAIKDTEEYQNLPEDQKVLDTFLRAYSTEYSQDYPFNATYKGNQFFMVKKGTMNAITKKYYEQYLTDNALTGSTDTKLAFKKLVSQ